MVEVTVDPKSNRADMDVPNACPTCGGALSVRIAAGGSRGYCTTCRRLSAAQVKMTPKGMVLMHLIASA